MEGVKKTMEKALAEFLKVAQRECLWVHEDQAGRSQIVSTFRSGFAQGGVRVTESSRSMEILDFDVSDVFRVVSDEWETSFPGIVEDAIVVRDNESGIATIEAKLVALTPLIPARKVSLIRLCKTLEDGLVVAVDVSDPRHARQRGFFNRFPSGVLLEKVGEGSTRVTWIEHGDMDEGLIGIVDDSNLGPFSSRRWLDVLEQKLIQSQRGVHGCALPSIFIMSDLNHLADTFTIQTLAKKMVGDMFEVISPTIGEVWRQFPLGPEFEYFRITYKEKKCVMVHSGWLEHEAEYLFWSFQEQRDAWDASVNDTLEVERDYGDGACLLRRLCGDTGTLKNRILQHISPLTRMMVFSRFERGRPFDLLTEGFAILPCRNKSVVTTVLVHEVPDEVDLTLKSEQIAVAELLLNKWLNFYDVFPA